MNIKPALQASLALFVLAAIPACTTVVKEPTTTSTTTTEETRSMTPLGTSTTQTTTSVAR